jgi:hypothetical protein
VTLTSLAAVLEAHASGLSALVSSVGAPKEYIRPDETDVICEAGNA